MSSRPSRVPGSARWRLPVSILDVKLGARLLLKHPLMTVVSVISLAVGIPVGLAPMHAIDAYEAPLPVQHGERVMGVRYWSTVASGAVPATYYDFSAWRDAPLRSFQGLAAVRIAEHNLDPGTAGASGPVSTAEVTGAAFSVLRTRPLLGRALGPSDEAAGAPPVVVLGYDVWQSRFGGAPDVVNRTVSIGGVVHTIVGVMPRDFLFPVRQQMWLPLRERPTDVPGHGARLQVFGRLADGVTPQDAQSELDVVAQRMGARFPEVYPRIRGEVVPFAVAIQGSPQGGWRALPGTWLISVGAMLMLVVACANVGLLVFARTASRSGELAVRAALGAGRTRIVAQVFVEVLVMAVVATVVGLLLIELLSNRLFALTSASGGGLPWWIDMGVTPSMVVDALLLAVFSAAVASIIPALRVTGGNLQESLRRAGATGAGIRLGRLSSALVVIDMALAVAVVGVVVAVSERMESMGGAQAASFRPEQFLSAEVTLPEAALSWQRDTLDTAVRQRVAAVQGALVERLQGEAGVRGVAVADVLPRMDHGWAVVEVEGGVSGDHQGAHEVEEVRVDPGFFTGLGQPLLAGRAFNAADLQGDRRAVIVNRKFVERTLGGRSAIGRRVRYFSPEGNNPWFEIVGVVPDLATTLTDPRKGLGLYHPAAPGEIYPMRFAVHLGSDPASFIPRLRELASGVDPSVIVTRTEALDQVYSSNWYMMRGLRLGWTAFVGVLLVLAISGIYTIMAVSVAQRTREIGIRTALGARPRNIVTAIGTRAAIQVGVGALVGMLLAGWIYFDIYDSTTSVRTAFLVALLPGVVAIALVGIFACTAPLLRALRIMPTVAMRTEA